MIATVADNTPRRALPDAPAAAPSEEPERAADSRLEAWRSRYELVSDIATPSRIGLVLAAVVLVLTGAFGGLDAVQTSTEEVPSAAAGTPLKVPPLAVTVASLRHADALPPVARAIEGRTYYMAVLEVTNTGDRVVRGQTFADALTLEVPGVEVTGPAQVYRVEDSLLARGFQPGVPNQVVALWTAPSSAPVATDATLTLSSLTWHKYLASASAEWRVDEPVFRLTLPVKALGKS